MKMKFTTSRGCIIAARKKPDTKKQSLFAFIGILLSCYAITGYAQINNTKAYSSGTPDKSNDFFHAIQPWLIRGNSGTNPAVNFIGTRDAKPLVFKVNNQKAGYLDFNDTIQNTSFGYQTLHSNIVSGEGHGSFLSAFGWGALSANTSGYENTAHGSGSLFSNTTGAGNTGVGHFALIANTTAGLNTATGAYSLASNTTGESNTASGAFALASNTTGNFNMANGTPFTLAFNTEGSENIATGALSLGANNIGNSNAAYGVFSLASNETGSNNTALGSHADVAAGDLTNATAIGNGALADASNKVRIGNAEVTSIGGEVGWTSYSDERIKDNIQENVPGLDFIKALRPVTYHFSVSKQNTLLGIKDINANKMMSELKNFRIPGLKSIQVPSVNVPGMKINNVVNEKNHEIEKIQFTGFLAQDVEKAAKDINYDFSGIDKTGKVMGLRYSDFVVPLVKAVQELSRQNEDLQKQIVELKSLVAVSSKNEVHLSDASIGQNVPNPFSQKTIIDYSLPRQFSKAEIIIIDKTGKTLKRVNLSGKGRGTVNIDAATLSAGAYNYSLIVDGRLIETKNMLLAK